MKHQDVIRKIIDAWNASSTILLTASSNFDGDALGCTLALAEVGKKQGKNMVIVNEKPVSYLYDFLGIKETIHTTVPDLPYDLIIASDTGSLHMLWSVYDDNRELFERVPLVNIDHHESCYGKICWSTCSYENTAATMMIATLIDMMGEEITPTIALYLLLGIYYDTECFHNSNTTPHALAFAGRMLESGADHNFLIRNLYQSTSPRYVALYGEVLSSLISVWDGRGVIGIVTKKMLDKHDINPDSLGNEFVNNYLRSISADFVVLIKDTGSMRRLSFRSKNQNLSVREMAMVFGGWGHEMASGAGSELSVEEIIDRIQSFPIIVK